MDETIRLNRLSCPIRDLKHTKHPFFSLSLSHIIQYFILYGHLYCQIVNVLFVCVRVCACETNEEDLTK